MRKAQNRFVFKKLQVVILLHLFNVYKNLPISDPTKAEDVFYTREREVTEIEGLIPEIREKIADTNDMKEETFKKLGDKRMFEEGMKTDPAKEPTEVAPVSNGGKCRFLVLFCF